MADKNHTQDKKILVLEQKIILVQNEIKELRKNLDLLRNNDLKHLSQKIDDLDNRIYEIKNWMLGLLGGIVSTLITAIVSLIK